MFTDPRPRSAPRSAHLTFRLTLAERKIVQAAASDADLSVGQLIRRALAYETSRDGKRDEETTVAA
jgi:hypothetical protein